MTPEQVEAILEAEVDRATDFKGHIRWLYADLCRRGAKALVELGVWTGQSTAAFLLAADANDGRLVSVDVNDYPQTRARMTRHGLAGRWDYQVMSDLVYARDRKEPIDALLIDTSHERKRTLAELIAFAPLMAATGVIYLHDVEAPHGYKVCAALTDWLLDSSGWRLMESFTHSHGLAVVERAPCAR